MFVLAVPLGGREPKVLLVHDDLDRETAVADEDFRLVADREEARTQNFDGVPPRGTALVSGVAQRPVVSRARSEQIPPFGSSISVEGRES